MFGYEKNYTKMKTRGRGQGEKEKRKGEKGGKEGEKKKEGKEKRAILLFLTTLNVGCTPCVGWLMISHG